MNYISSCLSVILGHVISKEGVANNPSKVEIIKRWPVPSSAKDVRSFLGMAGYYRRFVKGFGVIRKTSDQFVRMKRGNSFFGLLKLRIHFWL